MKNQDEKPYNNKHESANESAKELVFAVGRGRGSSIHIDGFSPSLHDIFGGTLHGSPKWPDITHCLQN